jgi:hypothetical protein
MVHLRKKSRSSGLTRSHGGGLVTSLFPFSHVALSPRRGPGRCTHCISGDGVVEPPDDGDRRYWLERFSDEELAEIVWFVFGHRPDRAHICSERERLLGAVVAA